MTMRFRVPALTLLLALVASAPLTADRAVAQERLDSSPLAGVAFPEPSWNRLERAGGSRTDAIRAAATLVE